MMLKESVERCWDSFFGRREHKSDAEERRVGKGRRAKKCS